MQRIADLRTTIENLDDADLVLQQIAQAECRIAKEEAKLELLITDAKARHAERILEIKVQHITLAERLAAFIESARGLFVRPRKRKTDFGSYGLETVTEVRIADEDALVERLLELGYEDCLKVTHKPVKQALKDRIAAGETFPGVQVVSGDTAVYKVAKALLDEAREVSP
jgi:hypothetical protein